MLIKRLLVIIFLAPVFIAFVVMGGWKYQFLIAAAMAVAAWEFWRIFVQGGFSPALPLLTVGSAALPLLRGIHGFDWAGMALTAIVLLAMTWHVVEYGRGKPNAAIDFLITLGGVLYLGWMGSYFVLIRDLPSGLWWTLLVTFSIWIADSGAFFIGSRWGNHKMFPRVSPQKSWEGYAGGILFAVLGTTLLAALWQTRVPEITTMHGFWLGLIIALVTPMGDLGESLIKRQFNVKDSSNLLPGHGGILDRIDSWLWAIAIGYYLIIFLC